MIVQPTADARALTAVDLAPLTARHPLPTGFVLRELLDLDIDDVEGLCRIQEEHAEVCGFVRDSLALLPREEWRDTPLEREQEEVAVYAETRRPRLPMVATKIVQYHLRAARAVTRQWIAYDGDEKPRVLLDAWREEGFNRPDTSQFAWHWWTAYVNAGLSCFSVRVSGMPDLGMPPAPPPLYSACMLQLAGIVSDGLPIRYCANERCGKPFTKQRTSGAFQRATGVLYCSNKCARAQAERERRRRHRKGT